MDDNVQMGRGPFLVDPRRWLIESGRSVRLLPLFINLLGFVNCIVTSLSVLFDSLLSISATGSASHGPG